MANVNSNTPYIYQAATILSSLYQQMSGHRVLTPTNTGEFVSVAQTALRTGYDPVINGLSQMWGKTLFSARPYSGAFSGLEMSAERWGNAIRKISFADSPVNDDDRFTYPAGYDGTQTAPMGNGESVDMFKLHKPEVLQTVFYGQSVFQDTISIFRDNFDVAFRSPEEFMQFNSGVMTNRANKLEQYRESIRRGLIANAIGAVIDESSDDRIIHALTEYNAETGLALTATSVFQPDNFRAFIPWLHAKVQTLARLMRERNTLFTTQIDGKTINRHTPGDKLKVYMYAKLLDQISSMVLPFTFHDDALQFADVEGVSYWQSVESPDSISVTPTYTDSTGAAKTAAEAVEQENIIGIMFDEDSIGYAPVNQWSAVTPFVVNGGYWNETYHINFRTRFDMTEKMVVLVLD